MHSTASAAAGEEVQQQQQQGKRGPDGGQLQLPPGFRFYPSDEELVVHYLCKRAASQPFAVPIIAEVDLYKFDPWDLPGKALFGEKEWYFFSPRDRKYPNGSRPNRAAGSGYWKATGTDKPICMAQQAARQKVGVKKALVFYKGRPPKGDKTNWIMHEYRLADSAAKAARRKGSLRLDDWVLCRIYKKLPSATRLAMQKEEGESEEASCGGFEEVLEGLPEEDSKYVSVSRFSSGTVSGMGAQPTSCVNYNGNVSDTYNEQQFVNMGLHLQMAPSSVPTRNLNTPFTEPAHACESNHNPNLIPCAGPTSCMNIPSRVPKPDESFMGNLAANFSTRSVPRLNVPMLVLGNHDSPMNSSVDEEEHPHVMPPISNADPPPVFNFDALPSPFGRLESFQHFAF